MRAHHAIPVFFALAASFGATVAAPAPAAASDGRGECIEIYNVPPGNTITVCPPL